MDEARCSLRVTRRYEAPAAEVWAALTERESLARWLGAPRALELEPGGSFDLELTDGTAIAGSIRTLVPGRVLEMDWAPAGERPSVVRFELAEDNERTVLVLDHRRIDERFGMAHLGHWERAMARFSAELPR